MKPEDLEKIRSKVLKSGFPTEIEVAKCFLENAWDVNYNSYYIDRDEKKGREIDLIADYTFHTGFKYNNYLEMAFNFIVEVKKDETKPWIFFITERTSSEKRFNIPTTYVEHNVKNAPSAFKKHYGKVHSMIARNAIEGVIDKNAKSGQGIDKIFAALCNVTKALSHAMESSYVVSDESTDMVFEYFEPLIVFSGELLVASLDDNGSLELKETDYVQMKFNYLSPGYQKKYSENIIHIVKKSYLDEFIKMRYEQFGLIYDYVLEEAKKKGLAKTDNIPLVLKMRVDKIEKAKK
jgi:hypothetical protein